MKCPPAVRRLNKPPRQVAPSPLSDIVSASALGVAEKISGALLVPLMVPPEIACFLPPDTEMAVVKPQTATDKQLSAEPYTPLGRTALLTAAI